MARVSSEVRELAREISAVKRGLRDATVTPQLGRSSLDDESINAYDGDGNLRARYGLQHDGTYTAAVLDGPVPPVPSVPTVSGGPGELTVAWDGTYVDDARAPMDFHVVEVWAADTDFSERSEARLLGHFANESGGDITVARPVGEWHVALVSKAQSGRRSAVSGRAGAVVESVVDQGVIDDLNEKLDGLPSVTWSEDPPTAADGDGKPDNAVWRQVDASTDAVIGEWTWDETNGVWVARPIADDAIYSLDVGKLFASQLGVDTAVANEIWAAKIAASKIDAEEINTQSLGADAGFIGVLNSAEIVGAVIKTAATGARVELDSGNGIRIFNTAGDLVLSADSDGNLVTGVNQDSSVRIAPKGIDLTTLGSAQLRAWPTVGTAFSVAVSGSRVYVATSGGRTVEVYDLAGAKQLEWPVGSYAESIAVWGNRVYVGLDTGAVEVYNTSGAKQAEWAVTAGYPRDMAATSTSVYVATGPGHTIEVYNTSGAKQAEWATPTNANSIAVSGDRVYIRADLVNSRVDVYDLTGTKQTELPITGIQSPIAVAGNLIYTGRSGHIDVYDLDGVKQAEIPIGARPWSLAVSNDLIYSATHFTRTVEVYSVPGTEHTTASLDSTTGRLAALSADLGGVTRTETLTPRNILPRGRTDNEDYAPTVEIVRPAFTQGLHVFEDTTHRDLELPDPPDGTQAWTGTGNSLKQWTRINGAWEAIHTGPHYLRIGDDGAPRLWADPELIHGRDYDNAGPGADRNRVMVVTRFGTFGTLSGALDRDYLPQKFAGGRVLLPTPVSGQVVYTTVTFPNGTFTSRPDTAWATADTTVPGDPVVGVSVSSVTQTSMRIYLRRTSTADTGIYWGAAQL